MSINEPIFKNSGAKQISTVNTIVSILDIKFEDDNAQKELSAIWTANAQEFRLTPKEMVNAYQYAINQKIVSKNGTPIKVFPNLSIITQAEIFNAYINFKLLDVEFQKGVKLIASTKLKPVEKTQEEINRDEIGFYQDQYKYFLEHGEVEIPGPLFELLIKDFSTINCTTVVSILSTYRPKAKDDKKLKRFDKYEPVHHFVKTAVEGTIRSQKLDKLSIDEWVNYFLKLKSK